MRRAAGRKRRAGGRGRSIELVESASSKWVLSEPTTSAVKVSACVRVDGFDEPIVRRYDASGVVVNARNETGEWELSLATNRHVLSGRDPLQGCVLDCDGKGIVPSTIEMEVAVAEGSRQLSIDLYDETGAGRWRVHPTDSLTDVAVLPLDDVYDDQLTYAPADFFGRHYDAAAAPFLRPDVRVGDAVVLAAFPRGRASSRGRALLMQALVASPVELDMAVRVLGSDEPQSTRGFLIDSPSAISACSGGVVYLYDRSWRVPEGLTISTDHRQAFPLGLYSGRIQSDVTVGRVEALSCVRDVLEHGVRTRVSWDDRFDAPPAAMRHW
jgi:hypothetical protein